MVYSICRFYGYDCLLALLEEDNTIMSGMIFLTISKVAIFATLAVVYFYLATRERTPFFWIAFEAWLLLTLQGMLLLGVQDGLPGFVTALMTHTTPFLLASLLLWGVTEFANRPLPAGWFYTAGGLFVAQLLTNWLLSEPFQGTVSAGLLLSLYAITAYFLKGQSLRGKNGWAALFWVSTLLYGLSQMAAYIFPQTLALEGVIVMCVTSVGVGLCLAYFDRLHESLQEKEQQLRLSEEKFSKMFFASPMATVLSRVSDRRYIEVNDKFLELTGYSRDEVIGQTAAALDIFYLKEQEQMIGESLATYGRAPTVEVVYQGKSGKLGVCLVSMEIISVGGEICFLSIVEDITTRRQVEEAMLQTQKLESLGVLAGGIAHDFNNLLVAMMGQTSLALRKLDGDARARANIEKALSAAEKAAALTQQLLSYAGQGVTEFRPTDLN
ncbi:MAG: PAS domain S-box protein, partial [Anaerolineales bacterium]|nr:PAS domain S-box protein [Anaerolineales bacterium]